MKELPSYENIYLRPKFSSLPHRAEADTSVEFLGRKFKLPVVPANMEDVISPKLAYWLAKNDYFYIMHRFKGATVSFVGYCLEEGVDYISISTGVGKDSMKEIDEIIDKYGGDIIDYITIDVAHGHHQNVKNMMEFLKDRFSGIKKPKFIAGNISTKEAYNFMAGLGVDAIKVGIGGGSICTTRFETGFHIPTAASVLECATCSVGYGQRLPIIADGGIQHHGDIAKALVLGASMVMCGGLFASCIDSPAKIQNGKKVYRGSTSYAAKGHDNHIEGKTIELEGELTYEKRLEKIGEALRSSISYAGGKNLSAFRGVEWDIVL